MNRENGTNLWLGLYELGHLYLGKRYPLSRLWPLSPCNAHLTFPGHYGHLCTHEALSEPRGGTWQLQCVWPVQRGNRIWPLSFRTGKKNVPETSTKYWKTTFRFEIPTFHDSYFPWQRKLHDTSWTKAWIALSASQLASHWPGYWNNYLYKT